MIVNVAEINVECAKFTAEGLAVEQAEQLCALKLLSSLYVNNVIKEANIEFHKRRKVVFFIILTKYYCQKVIVFKKLSYI